MLLARAYTEKEKETSTTAVDPCAFPFVEIFYFEEVKQENE